MKRLAACVALLGTFGCSDGADIEAEAESFGVNQAEIIGGVPNTTHKAVVVCFSSNGACSGTLIYKDGTTGYVLTAAHCMTGNPLQQCGSGDDYNVGVDWAANVANFEVHPQYDDQQLIYDFAMLRLSGVPASAEVIPAMTGVEDTLQVGTPILHVGYGITSVPNGSNTVRRSTSNTISQLFQIQLVYDQPISGPCSGDSGGPTIVNAGGSERVAGVVSFGDENCNQQGVSGRTSAVFPWIAAFTGETVDTTTSSSVTTAGVGGQTSVGVGGSGGADAGAGAGGTAPTGNWFAGDQEKQDNDGFLVTSCAMGATASAPREGTPLRDALLWSLPLAFFWLRRERVAKR